MVGIVVNKEFALTLGIVNEENIDIHPCVGDDIIITDVAVDNLGDIVSQHGFEVMSEEKLIELINNK